MTQTAYVPVARQYRYELLTWPEIELVRWLRTRPAPKRRPRQATPPAFDLPFQF